MLFDSLIQESPLIINFDLVVFVIFAFSIIVVLVELKNLVFPFLISFFVEAARVESSYSVSLWLYSIFDILLLVALSIQLYITKLLTGSVLFLHLIECVLFFLSL